MELTLLDKKKAIQKIENIFKLYTENENNEDSEDNSDDDIDINLFHPMFDTKEKREKPEIYGKHIGLTMKDMIQSDYLTRDFCDWCFNGYEWNYECNAGGRGDDLNFFNCIPPMLMDYKYQNITSLSITHTKIIKIEYIPHKVELLDLSCNQIEKIENIPKSIKYLDLNYNRIKKIENLPSNLDTFKIYENQIKKLENLPNKLTSIIIDIENINEFGDLSNLENKITIEYNSNKYLSNFPISCLKLELNYYPKGYKEIQYINNINIQNYYMKKWRNIILTKNYKKKYSNLLCKKEDELSKLSNLVFYIIIRFHNKDYSETYKSKEEYIQNKIEDFKILYKKNKEESYKYVMDELCKYIGENIRPIYNKRIKILSESNQFLKKIINYKRKIYFTEEQIRNTFDIRTEERELVNYFLDKTNVSKNNNYAEFLITREDNILIYPFYNEQNYINLNEDLTYKDSTDSSDIIFNNFKND